MSERQIIGMTVYEQQMSRDQRIEYYEFKIVWLRDHPDAAFRESRLRHATEGLIREIGQEEFDRWLEASGRLEMVCK